MKKLAPKLVLIVISLILLWIYSFPWANYGINIPYTEKEYKLWLDLQGWVELDYKIDLDELRKEADYTKEKEKQAVEWLKSIIDKRIEILKINDSTITSANYGWEEHIIVQIPLKWKNDAENKLNVERAKTAIWKVVKIEFKEERTEVTKKDLDDRQKLASDALAELKDSKYPFNTTSAKYKDNNENVAIWNLELELKDLNKYFKIDSNSLKNWLNEKILTWTGVENLSGQEWNWIIFVNKIDNSKVNFDYIFITKNPSEWKPAMDSKWRILNDKYFVKAAVQYNEAFQPMIELNFNDEWAEIFWELTKRLVWKPIAIFVWWEMLTSPNVNEAILNGKAVITWNYTSEEANKLSTDINTWVVPAPIYLTSEKSIDSRLWMNSLQKLIVAWFAWFVLIFFFLIFTYRFSWFMASIALLFYVVLILAVVKFFWFTLTLASIAWLILSIWMAIDANVLIFERTKEEIREWKSFTEATIIWFKTSWTAIWDTHVTWLIVSIILFIFWINLIKWFGLMLAAGLLVSLFTAIWISRILILFSSKISDKKEIFIGKV